MDLSNKKVDFSSYTFKNKSQVGKCHKLLITNIVLSMCYVGHVTGSNTTGKIILRVNLLKPTGYVMHQ